MHLCLAEIKGDLTFFTLNDNLGEKKLVVNLKHKHISLLYVNLYASRVILFKKKALRNICMYF